MIEGQFAIDYRDINNKASEGILVFQDGRLIFSNSIVSNLMERTELEIEKESFLSFVHPDDQITFAINFTARLLGEKPSIPFPFRITTTSGDKKWIQVNPITVEWNGEPALLCYINDISKLKDIEDELRHSEKQYRNIVENVKEGIYEVDLLGNMTFVNKSLCEIFGYNKHELLKLNYNDFLDQKSAIKIFKIFNDVYKYGTMAEVSNWSIINKKKNKHFFDSSVSLIKDSAGNKIGFRGIIRDITLRKETEDRLKESEEEYRLLVENISDTIYKIKSNGYLSYVSPSALKKTGYTRKEMLNLYYLDLVADEYKEEVKEIMNNLHHAEEGHYLYHELKIKKANKDFLWVGQNAKVVCNNEGEREVYVVARNITKLKQTEENLEQSERKYRELVEKKTQDVIFSLDTKFKFQTVNRNIFRLLGYSEMDVVGEHIVDILYRDPNDHDGLYIETFLDNLLKVISNSNGNINFKAVCSHKTLGEPVPLNFKLDPIYDNNEITGIIGFMYPQTDDPMRDFLIKKSVSYEIDNKITTANTILNRLTRDLKKYIDDDNVSQLSTAIMEIIINAIEHGNLQISFDEKSEAKKSGTYFELLKERLAEPKNKEKKVYIDYTMDSYGVVYTIRDEGKGFNHEKLMSTDADTVNNVLSQNGRGILIAMGIFDIVDYNDSGNEVTLTKYFTETTDT